MKKKRREAGAGKKNVKSTPNEKKVQLHTHSNSASSSTLSPNNNNTTPTHHHHHLQIRNPPFPLCLFRQCVYFRREAQLSLRSETQGSDGLKQVEESEVQKPTAMYDISLAE